MEYKNILIIKMSSLGDILHSLPFAAALRKRFPAARITWLVHPQFAGFLPDPPLIDEVLYFDKVKFNKMGLAEKYRYFCEMQSLLRSRRFDLVIDLQGLLKSAVLAALTGCKERIGYSELREGSSLVSRAIVGPHSKDHVIERYLDVARYLGAETDDIEFPLPDLSKEEAAVAAKLKRAGLPEKKKYVVLVPGARWETKCWPAEHFARLARLLGEEGTYAVLAGGPGEKDTGLKIKEKAAVPFLLDLTGETNLRELAALIKNASFYISADTGPLHLAAAMKKPLIALYGPTKPDRTGPYGSAKAAVLTAPLSCAGCLKKHCSKWECMKAIEPEAVYALYKKKKAEDENA